ncbi:MAG: OmpH family outer membrane protein [Gammaproteobacteria bacterium]
MKSNRTWPMMFAAALLALAPGLVAAQQLKIGVADLAELRAKAPQAQAASTALEREFASRQRELIAEQEQVQRLQERLTREADVLADQEQAMTLERDLRNRQRDLQRNVSQYEEDLNLRRNEELSKLQRQILTEVQTYAREQNFDLVLVEGVIFASDKVNITAAVLQRLQSRNTPQN